MRTFGPEPSEPSKLRRVLKVCAEEPIVPIAKNKKTATTSFQLPDSCRLNFPIFIVFSYRQFRPQGDDRDEPSKEELLGRFGGEQKITVCRYAQSSAYLRSRVYGDTEPLSTRPHYFNAAKAAHCSALGGTVLPPAF